MNKIVIAAMVLVIAGGGYWLTKEEVSKPNQANVVLASIPADTPIFSGQLQPFPIEAYINSLSQGYKTYPKEQLAEMDKSDDPVAKFILSLTKAYITSLQSGEQFIKTFGLNKEVRSYFYTLGLLPVFKIEVAQSEAIWALLDKAELDSGLSHTQATLEGLEYRAYTLSAADAPYPITLLFAQQDGLLTVTLDNPTLGKDVLMMAFGLTKAKDSLADSGMLEQLIKTFGFSHAGVGFINHKELVEAITTTDGNLLASQLTTLMAQVDEDPLAELRTPECHKDLTAVAFNWPRTVFGITAMNITDTESSFNVDTIVEVNNPKLIEAFKNMRGFIPNFVKDADASVISMALGIDVNQFASSLTSVWDELLTPEFTCPILLEAQQEIAGQNPGMIGMFTSMASGVKGVSAALLDYKFVEQSPGDNTQGVAIESIDALIALSADNPGALFNMVKSFAPGMGSINLAKDGSATDLTAIFPIVKEFGLAPQLAIKGQHLVLYSGDKGAIVAQGLTDEALVSNGLYSLAMDYQKLFTPVVTLAEMTGEPLPPEFAEMKDYNVQIKMGLDIIDRGIIFDSFMNNKVTPASE